MTKGIVTTFMASALLAAITISPALAQRQNADDVAWIKRCVADNKDEGQSADVVLSYCTCMNNEMSSSETRSITAWEKANPKIAESCGTKAGWKGK
jgi:hypothetical protein